MASMVLTTNGDCADTRPSTPLHSLQKNVAPAGWIVQKFGGTSVGKFAIDIVENVVARSVKHHRVAIVCSARSSHTKAEGTTNRLLRAAVEASKPGSKHYQSIVDLILQDHLRAADEQIKSADILERLKEGLRAECEDLSTFLDATQRVGEISSRSEDRIISKGEKLSCRLVAALLQDRGVASQYVDLSDILSSTPLYDRSSDQVPYDRLASALALEIRKCGDRVPVLTGYFGSIPGGLLKKIGRGYTDLCAALVAVGIAAEELQIWKEVDGIFTADPRKVPTARLLPTITPTEAAELTFYGSEVIHPFTMEQVINARIPIRIKNVMNPLGCGTFIFPDPPASSTPSRPSTPGQAPSGLPMSASTSSLFRLPSTSLLSSIHQSSRPRRPTAVTIKHQIIVLNVHSNKRSLSHGFFARIFSTLDKWRLSVDLISTSEVHVSMAIHSDSSALLTGDSAMTEVGAISAPPNGTTELTEDELCEHELRQIQDDDLREAIKELHGYGKVDLIPNMAILSLVGKQMKNMIGIAGRMFSVLGEHGVNIEMISQGASEINISCVIEEKDADRAINILHTNLFTFLD